MCSSEICSFSAPDRYAWAIRSAVMEISATESQPFVASLTFHHLWIKDFAGIYWALFGAPPAAPLLHPPSRRAPAS